MRLSSGGRGEVVVGVDVGVEVEVESGVEHISGVVGGGKSLLVSW